MEAQKMKTLHRCLAGHHRRRRLAAVARANPRRGQSAARDAAAMRAAGSDLTWPPRWLLVTTMALTNAEKQARWRERHAMKRYAVQSGGEARPTEDRRRDRMEGCGSSL
jgi:hypothetical protein